MKCLSSGWNLTRGAYRQPLAIASSSVEGGATGQLRPSPPESTRGTEHAFPYSPTDSPTDSPRRARHVQKNNAARRCIFEVAVSNDIQTRQQL